MSEEVYIQLFWFLLFVVVFCVLLAVIGTAVHQLERMEYRDFCKLQKAKKTWAKMMGDNNG